MKPIIILGGGVCGLGAAYYFVTHKIPCIILERAPMLGGLAGSYSINGYSIERFYHHLFKNDTTFLQLAKELGVGTAIEWCESSTAFFNDGKFYPFASPIDLLRFAPLPFIDRLRIGWNVLTLGDGKGLEKINAEQWLVQKWGRTTYETLFQPMLKTKFGVDISQASAAFVHGRLKARASSRTGSKELLGYCQGGFHIVIDALVRFLEQSDYCTLMTGEEIQTIEKDSALFTINTQKTGIQGNVVLNTLPLSLFKSMVRFSFPSSDIKYRGVVCLLLGLKKPLTKYYWTNVLDNLPFGGIVEHTNWITKSRYNNEHLVYFVNYCDKESDLFHMTDHEVLQYILPGIRKINLAFQEDDIIWYKVGRDPCATPIFDLSFEKKDVSAKTPVNGLFLAGSFQTYPNSRSMSSVIKKGFEAAELILNENKEKI